MLDLMCASRKRLVLSLQVPFIRAMLTEKTQCCRSAATATGHRKEKDSDSGCDEQSSPSAEDGDSNLSAAVAEAATSYDAATQVDVCQHLDASTQTSATPTQPPKQRWIDLLSDEEPTEEQPIVHSIAVQTSTFTPTAHRWSDRVCDSQIAAEDDVEGAALSDGVAVDVPSVLHKVHVAAAEADDDGDEDGFGQPEATKGGDSVTILARDEMTATAVSHGGVAPNRVRIRERRTTWAHGGAAPGRFRTRERRTTWEAPTEGLPSSEDKDEDDDAVLNSVDAAEEDKDYEATLRQLADRCNASILLPENAEKNVLRTDLVTCAFNCPPLAISCRC